MRKDVQDRRSDVQITPRTFWEPALYAVPLFIGLYDFRYMASYQRLFY